MMHRIKKYWWLIVAIIVVAFIWLKKKGSGFLFYRYAGFPETYSTDSGAWLSGQQAIDIALASGRSATWDTPANVKTVQMVPKGYTTAVNGYDPYFSTSKYLI